MPRSPVKVSIAMTRTPLPSLGSRLDAIRGATTPTRRPNVRSLATYAPLSQCGLASLIHGLGINSDRLLDGLKTSTLQSPFGQSLFAMTRGQMFENYLVRNEGEVLVAALQRDMGFSLATPRIIDLRKRCPRNYRGMQLRASRTKQLLLDIIANRHDAPNLIIGAVFETTIAGIPSYLEADAVAARDSGLPRIYTGEIKSFPIVDGRIDSQQLGKAADQAAVYQLLLETLLVELGDDSAVVSDKAMIVTPVNTGFQPKVSTVDISSRVCRAREQMRAAPQTEELASLVPAATSFETVANKDNSDSHRLDALNVIADSVGTKLCDSCLSSCSLFRVCRGRAHAGGELAVIGDTPARILPGLGTMAEVCDLSTGAPAPAGCEAHAAALVDGQELYSRLAGISFRAASSVTP
jgi:hypothetical protein